MSLDYIAIGNRIQHYRLAIDKTQNELAEMAGISTNYLSKLETGKAAGRLEIFYNISQALGVTLDMLIDNTSERVSANDQLFSNQLLPLITHLSLNQRKMLIDFIDLLNCYDVDKINPKRG